MAVSLRDARFVQWLIVMIKSWINTREHGRRWEDCGRNTRVLLGAALSRTEAALSRTEVAVPLTGLEPLAIVWGSMVDSVLCSLETRSSMGGLYTKYTLFTGEGGISWLERKFPIDSTADKYRHVARGAGALTREQREQRAGIIRLLGTSA